MNNHLLVIGASSDIAAATATRFATAGFRVSLASRNVNRLQDYANDLHIRTQQAVDLYELDIRDQKSRNELLNALPELPSAVLCAVGYLGDQAEAQTELSAAEAILETNYNAVCYMLNPFADQFEKRGSGSIIAISSVAGDRGRKSNYLYGPAKAGLSAYLSGLRNRLFAAGVYVLEVRPGFVHTKMTAGMALPEKLTASPEAVAEKIYQAAVKKKDVIYVKSIWRLIMFVIRNLPEFVFKRTSL